MKCVKNEHLRVIPNSGLGIALRRGFDRSDSAFVRRPAGLFFYDFLAVTVRHQNQEYAA